MVEIAWSLPAITVSVHGNGYQNYLFCCLHGRDVRMQYQSINKCRAFLELRFKTKPHSNHIYGRNVVSLVKAPVKWLRSVNWMDPCTVLSSTTMENYNSYFLSSKHAASFEFESVSENDKVLIQNQGDFDEISVEHILPHWNGFTEHASDDGIPLHKSSTIVGKTCVVSDDKFYYLEERSEKVLSKRIVKLSRLNKVRSAFALFRSMQLCGLLPNLHACNSLLSCLMRSGRLHDALNMFEFMKTNEVISGHSYSLILKGVASSMNCDTALAMFEEAEKDFCAKKYLDVVVYNTMIAVVGKVNNWVQAERLWRNLRNIGLVGTIVTYRMLICTFVRSGQNELALDAYHELVQNGLNPCNDASEAIIGACTREGKWEMALNVFRSMSNTGLKPSLISCNALINSLGKAGNVGLAFKIYNIMKSFGHVPDAYSWNGLLGALYRANQHADALRLFESIRKEHKPHLNLHVYNTCLMCCRKLGLWGKAMQLLWEMETAGLPVSVSSYNLVIRACEAARKPEIALQVYEHMVQLRIPPDTFTLLSLLRSCIWGSLWNRVEEIIESTPNVSLYNAAIQGMCLRSQANMARNLYMEMQKIGLKPDGKTRALMLQTLPRG